MSIRLYIGNLPKELDKQELQAVFAEEGESVSTKVITDRKTGKCRGFGFVTVPNGEKADEIIEKFNGYLFKESALKIEKALPRSKGKGDKAPEKGEEEQQQQTPRPTGGGGGGKSNRRRNDNKSSRRQSSLSHTPQMDGDVQPDPRWASALEELKQRLAAQATNT